MSTKQLEVEEIVAKFADSRVTQTNGSGRNLREWIDEYPEAAEALTEYALYSNSESGSKPDNGRIDALAMVVSATADKVREHMMATHPLYRVNISPIQTIREEAASVNIEVNDLAKRLNISKTVLAKLDRRIVQADTIPTPIIKQLALALRRTVDDVKEYFTLPPTLAANASYKSKSAPSVQPKETFERAILTASDMTAEQKAEWNNGTNNQETE